MIKFTDKSVLDFYGIDCEYVRRELNNLFPENSKGILTKEIQDVANKIIADYIETGALDTYIKKYSLKFSVELKKTIERDIGAIIVSALKQWGYTNVKEWSLDISDVRTHKDYAEMVMKKTTWGESGTLVHKSTEKYATELQKISDIIAEGMLKIASNEKDLKGTVSILTEFISDEIRTKEDLLNEHILIKAQDVLSKDTTQKRVEQHFSNNKEKITKFNALIENVIDVIIQKTHPEIFKKISDEKMDIAKQELKRHLVDKICDTLCASESCLYNEIWLRDEPKNKNSINTNFSLIRNTIQELSESITNVAFVPQADEMYESELESISEYQECEIEEIDEPQWEELEYITHNKYQTESNIVVAIENAVNEGISDIIDCVFTKESQIGDEILSNDISNKSEKVGTIAKFVNNKNKKNIKDKDENITNKNENIIDEENEI